MPVGGDTHPGSYSLSVATVACFAVCSAVAAQDAVRIGITARDLLDQPLRAHRGGQLVYRETSGRSVELGVTLALWRWEQVGAFTGPR